MNNLSVNQPQPGPKSFNTLQNQQYPSVPNFIDPSYFYYAQMMAANQYNYPAIQSNFAYPMPIHPPHFNRGFFATNQQSNLQDDQHSIHSFHYDNMDRRNDRNYDNRVARSVAGDLTDMATIKTENIPNSIALNSIGIHKNKSNNEINSALFIQGQGLLEKKINIEDTGMILISL